MENQTETTTLPPKHKFNTLPDAERERLVAALEQTSPELFIRPFAIAVAKRSGTDIEWTESFCTYLADWFQFLADDATNLFAKIVAFLSSDAEQGDDATSDPVLTNQWERIMHADSTLGVTLKAAEIQRRQAHAYQKAVLTTEIRPVYLTDPNQPPSNAIVLHQLHLTYQNEYGLQTAHVAMDSRAIFALQFALDRALIKEKTLIEQKAYHYLGKVSDAKHS